MLLKRIIFFILFVSFVAFVIGISIYTQDIEKRMIQMENTTAQRFNTISAQLAVNNLAFAELENQLNDTRKELSLDTINLREALQIQSENFKVETEELRLTAEILESDLFEEKKARIDSGIDLNTQISSIQIEGVDIELNITLLLESVVLVACEISPDNFSQGSGTIIDASGTIITNAHVIDPNNNLSDIKSRLCVIGVTESELNPPVYKYIAEIQSVNHEEDISLLHISGGVNGHVPPDTFSYLVYPSCETPEPKLNDSVYTVGYPVIGKSTFTITNGIVSGFLDGDIKTSAKIDQGNSGGALINSDGNLIGIPTYGVTGVLDSLGYVINLRERECNS